MAIKVYANVFWMVRAFFQGGLSSEAYVRVDLIDINDNRPAFYPLSYAVSLSTQSVPGTSVLRVTAHDPDAGENGRVTYRTAAGGSSPFFTLNKDTGETFLIIKKVHFEKLCCQFTQSLLLKILAEIMV